MAEEGTAASVTPPHFGDHSGCRSSIIRAAEPSTFPTHLQLYCVHSFLTSRAVHRTYLPPVTPAAQLPYSCSHLELYRDHSFPVPGGYTATTVIPQQIIYPPHLWPAPSPTPSQLPLGLNITNIFPLIPASASLTPSSSFTASPCGTLLLQHYFDSLDTRSFLILFDSG